MVFSWNNYVLKSFLLHELGIFDESLQHLKVEYRQKYFHLFFIPVFPVERFWAINHKGKMYDPPAQIMQLIQQSNTKTRNGIFAWSGILAAALIFIIYSISQSVEEKRNLRLMPLAVRLPPEKRLKNVLR